MRRKDNVLSVLEARVILGSTYDAYPDEVIEKMIDELESIAEAFIDSYRESNP